MVVEDGIRPFMDLTDQQQRTLMRVLVVVVGAVAYWSALDEGSSLVQLLLGSYGIICQLAPPVIAALYWSRATTAGVVAGLLAGAGTAVFFFMFGDLRPLDMHEGILGLMIHVPVLIAVSLATTPQSADHVAAFVRYGGAESTESEVRHV